VESNNQTEIKRKSNRGGKRPGAGRRPKKALQDALPEPQAAPGPIEEPLRTTVITSLGAYTVDLDTRRRAALLDQVTQTADFPPLIPTELRPSMDSPWSNIPDDTLEASKQWWDDQERQEQADSQERRRLAGKVIARERAQAAELVSRTSAGRHRL